MRTRRTNYQRNTHINDVTEYVSNIAGAKTPKGTTRVGSDLAGDTFKGCGHCAEHRAQSTGVRSARCRTAIQLAIRISEKYELMFGSTPVSVSRRFVNTFEAWRAARVSVRTSTSTPGAAVGRAEVKAAKANVAKIEMLENEGIGEVSRH